MKELFKSGFKYLLHPMAIGLYITVFVVAVAFQYYVLRGTIEGASSNINPVQKILNLIHQKSVDFRLTTRGPRKPSERVALVAVDDKSVSDIGRWPWPRSHIAKIIDEVMSNGASSLGFDITFSEPSAQPSYDLFVKLKKQGVLSGRAKNEMSKEVKLLDYDGLLEKSIKKYADKLVMGNFSASTVEESIPTYHDACFGFVFERFAAHKIWAKDEVLLFVLDANATQIPPTLKEAYQMTLQAIEDGVRDESPELPENEIKREAFNRQVFYCEQWLDPEKDSTYGPIAEGWPLLKEQDPDTFTEASYEEWVENYKASQLPFIKGHRTDWVMNISRLSSVSKHNGYFNAELDSDGTIRRKSLVTRSYDQWMPSIAFKSYLVAQNTNGNLAIEFDHARSKKVVRRLWVSDNDTGDELFDIPVDPQGNLTLNYAGPRHMFPYISAGDLVAGKDQIQITQKHFDEESKKWIDKIEKVDKAKYLKDKILIVGATAMGIFDLRVTPFDENYPGAETHLNVISNILKQDFFVSHPDEEKWMMVALLVMGLVVSFAISHMGPLAGLSVVMSVAIGTYGVDRYYLFGEGFIVAIAFPLFLIFFIYGVLTFYKYFTEERNKRELKTTFQKYVSPAIVDEILADPSNIQLGGRKANLTVFFSDIRGFTTISEKLDPQALSDLLNFYLTPMTDLVFENKGTLDKYMGDAVMAFFGAPLEFDDHAIWACRCALQSLEKLAELQRQLEEQGLPSIDIGIGLNSGEVSVGNMGSETVRSYTVMGDAVNLASRLEGINKQYGTRIIISEFTYAAVKNSFLCREVDMVRVKGKLLPVRIFELIAEGKGTDEQAKHAARFIEGYGLYHQREFTKALECFNDSLNMAPTDVSSQLYIDRCQDYINTPPSPDWDGVFVMTTK